jgi:NADH-quinone oxidoreductase subunit G
MTSKSAVPKFIMITIYIDNQPYQVKQDQNLLNACLSLGFDLPYFCWHPAMHSVGACRQCAVKQFKDEKDTRGRIVMSCMTPVAEGLRISVDDAEARAFRASVIEWLMVNHPHDCPVCDEGGECHLQDMTVMTGHNYRRTRFRKRTHKNQDLGPFVNHEMNRCIACYRCVRFYRDYAGGRDLDAFASHDHVYFGRHEDGALESEFSGNLVEVCPTGVFTDKTLKQHYTRKWDLQTAPSVCVHCSLGCNTVPGERYGTLRRILNRYNHEVNGYFLCDRGRFGYEFANSGRRIRKALISPSLNPSHQGRDNTTSSPLVGGDMRRGGGEGASQVVSKEAALKTIAAILSKSKGMIGIGSPRASLESNFALRSLVGADNFYSGMSTREHGLVTLIIDVLQKGPARTPSLHDVESADAILVLGEDLTNTATMLDLAVRQAARNKPKEMTEKMRIPAWDDNAVRNAIQDETGPLYIAWVKDTKLDDIAAKTFHAPPDDIARLGFAIAHEVDARAPEVSNLREATLKQAREIAEALKSAKRPLIIAGTSLGSESIIQAAANIAWSLCEIGKPAELCYTAPECNSIGLGLMNGGNLNDGIKTVHEGKADTVIILENDLYRRAGGKAIHDFLNKAKHVIVLDHLINPTSSRADIALPSAVFAESDGTFVNNEGRAQRFFRVFVPDHDIRESWKWLHDLLAEAGRPEAAQGENPDTIAEGLASTLPVFRPIRNIAPAADFRIAGQKIPRQPHRYSGRTAMLANISLHEPKPPDDLDSPLSFSMEGYEKQPPAPLISRYWSPGWNSVQALNKFQQEVAGPIKGGDAGKRLINPSQPPRDTGGPEGVALNYFRNIPEAFKPAENELFIVPLYHIFGSEELSILAPGIAGRAPMPYLAVNPDDASRLKVIDGENAELVIGDTKQKLVVRVSPAIHAGAAGLYTSLPASPVVGLPRYGRILKA